MVPEGVEPRRGEARQWGADMPSREGSWELMSSAANAVLGEQTQSSGRISVSKATPSDIFPPAAPSNAPQTESPTKDQVLKRQSLMGCILFQTTMGINVAMVNRICSRNSRRTLDPKVRS